MMSFVQKPTRLAVIGLTVLLAACGNRAPGSEAVIAAPADTKAVVTLPISINEVMVAAIDHASHEVWNAAVKEHAPKSDRDWTELEHHALQLVASSRTIMLAGTGKGDATWVQTADWKKYSQALTDGATAAVMAIRGKNADGIQMAGDQLLTACEDCHKVFKPEIPSEGKFHPHYR